MRIILADSRLCPAVGAAFTQEWIPLVSLNWSSFFIRRQTMADVTRSCLTPGLTSRGYCFGLILAAVPQVHWTVALPDLPPTSFAPLLVPVVIEY